MRTGSRFDFDLPANAAAVERRSRATGETEGVSGFGKRRRIHGARFADPIPTAGFLSRECGRPYREDAGVRQGFVDEVSAPYNSWKIEAIVIAHTPLAES